MLQRNHSITNRKGFARKTMNQKENDLARPERFEFLTYCSWVTSFQVKL
jgi:hypothetical protein